MPELPLTIRFWLGWGAVGNANMPVSLDYYSLICVLNRMTHKKRAYIGCSWDIHNFCTILRDSDIMDLKICILKISLGDSLVPFHWKFITLVSPFHWEQYCSEWGQVRQEAMESMWDAVSKVFGLSLSSVLKVWSWAKCLCVYEMSIINSFLTMLLSELREILHTLQILKILL